MTTAARTMAWRRWPVGRLLLILLLTLCCLALLMQFYFFCKVVFYSLYPPASTPVMQAAMRAVHAEQPDAELRYQWVDYDAIAPALKRAVIASEDANFLTHSGFEWEAIRSAWEHNQALARDDGSARGPMRGGSTITQQLAKNLFLSNDRSYFRKGQELVIAWMIEHVMDKRRILELYLNVAEWGEGVFGAEAAARHHYNVSAAQLSQRQAAQLAARLPNPRYYDKRGVTPYLESRTRTIMARQRQAAIP